MSNERLTPTSYLVLGLLAREGPSTPYELERHVGATLGNFWSFPHTLLYSEPARLAGLGLVTETRQQDGRRRRVFTITEAGLHALEAWLDRPHAEPTQLRDLGLLQLFFADLAAPTARPRLAEQQLATHRAKLSAYEETLRMGLLYERAAVEFWEDVAEKGLGLDEPSRVEGIEDVG
jgi:PadR family transcriptional regulator AphA